MGVYNLVQLIRSYVLPISLATTSSAFRELPLLSGKNRSHEQELCRSTVFIIHMSEAILLAIGLCVVAIVRRRSHNQFEFLAFLTASIIILAARVQDLYQTYFTAHQLFVPLSHCLLLTNLIDAFILPLGAWKGGLIGLLAAAVISEGFQGFWLWYKGRAAGMSVRFIFDHSMAKRLISYGVAYRINDYPSVLFTRLDLLWVTHFVGLKGLAIYTLAKSFFTAATEITSRLSTIVYARALNLVGQQIDRSKIAFDMERFIHVQLLVCVPIMAWGVVSWAPLIIRQWIPAYRDAVPMVSVIMLCTFFSTQNNVLFALWIAERRLWSYGRANLFGLLAMCGFLTFSWFVLRQHTLIAIAWSTVAGFASHFTYMVLTAGHEIWGWRTSGKVLLSVFSTVSWVSLTFCYIAPSFTQSVSSRVDFYHTGAASAAMLAALSPLLAYGLHASGGFSYLTMMLSRSSNGQDR